MNVKRITYAGMLLALGIILPQAFHLTGLQQTGTIFLPMHIPTLIAGFLLGPLYGMLVGILSPIISSILTGMPPFARLPFMVGELATYGFISGFLFHQLRLRFAKGGIYATLILSMIAGRLINALMLLVGANLFHVNCGKATAVIASTITGLPGIIIQLVLIPALIYVIQKRGILDEEFGTSKRATY